jgi:hypothetical protein
MCAAIMLAVTTLAVGCADQVGTPAEVETFDVPVFDARAMDATNFRAHARGSEEVPPVDTRAQGQAVFQLSADGEALSYQLNVANILNVLQAHIHQAPAGDPGPVVAWLYPSGPPATLIPGRSQGVLAEGVITSADLVGPLEGMDLDDLLADLRSGNAYVNVHTTAYPPGEIRGQIH